MDKLGDPLGSGIPQSNEEVVNMPRRRTREKSAQKRADRWRREVYLLQQIVDYVRKHGRTHYSRAALLVGRSPSWVIQRRKIIEEIFEDVYYDDGYFDILPSEKENIEKVRKLKEQRMQENNAQVPTQEGGEES